MRTFARFWSREGQGGQAIVMVALSSMTMLFAVGLAIDAGQLFSARRTMQEAADAGAYAAAVVLYQGGTVAQARAAAIGDIQRNAYVHGGDGGLTNVIVNTPPASGPYTGYATYAEVIINTYVRTALVPGQSTLNFVQVRAVAGAEPLNNGYAIMSLERGNVQNAFRVRNNGSIDLTGGGILVNSTHSQAIYSQQCPPNAFNIEEPHGIDVAGGASGCFPASTTPNTSQPQQADPFAGFPTPSTSGMTVYNSLPGGNPMIVSPGIYTVKLQGSGNTQIHMQSGIYILKAGMDGAGNSGFTSLPGGVFIFNTTMNYPNPGGTCGSINVVGNATSDLKAMTTGTYANFLMYQDPACTATMSASGNGTFAGTGTIYVPNAAFVFDGNNATLTGSQLVAKTVDIQNGNVTIDFNAGTTAQPILPRLAE